MTGASSMRTPRSAERRADAAGVRGGDGGAVHAQQPGWAPSMTPVLAEQDRRDLLAVDDHAHDDVARPRDLGGGGGGAWRRARAAQRSALPGVCVQTVSGKPARATLAAMREPMMPRPRKPMRSDMPESSTTGRFDAQPLARLERAGDLAGQRARRRAGRARARPARRRRRPAARGGGARRSARRSSARALRSRARRRRRRGGALRRPSRGAGRTRSRAAGIRARAPRSGC